MADALPAAVGQVEAGLLAGHEDRGGAVGLDLAVLFLSLCLFLIALAVFGRLEGNFAEEL